MRCCKSCGDELEDGNCYLQRINNKMYPSNCCRPCKRQQVKAIYRLHKQHPQPTPGTPCDCCGRSFEKLHLDHEHTGAGEWRGWLCHSCNIGIGHLGDSLEGIARAHAYLLAARLRQG